MNAVATIEDVDCAVAHSLGIGFAEIGPVLAGDSKSAGRPERGAVGQHDLSVLVFRLLLIPLLFAIPSYS